MQVIEIAINDTGRTDNNTAKTLFLSNLNSDTWYFNEAALPEEQSNEDAQRKCVDMETAARHCGRRLAVIQKWFDEAMKVRER